MKVIGILIFLMGVSLERLFRTSISKRGWVIESFDRTVFSFYLCGCLMVLGFTILLVAVLGSVGFTYSTILWIIIALTLILIPTHPYHKRANIGMGGGVLSMLPIVWLLIFITIPFYQIGN